MPSTLWSAPTQGRSGTGGTTTNARLCILRMRVAEVYVGIGTKIQKSALRDRIAADLVPTGDISTPCPCPTIRRRSPLW
ncbi:hypothetical protein DPMN_044357 [Dreissena polymorpha]|uniref:Uncharacterized protein n=1 Tax=Dreissena polymorpha TaxID=45954 RepID=A0A9D4D5P4_DREPO|nr:hypothetical protein DPMN_044357 [Dreissena polymorpha]